MNKKISYILEIIWLIILIFSAMTAIYQTYLNGFKENIMLYAIAFLATLMYLYRRYLRKTNKK